MAALFFTPVPNVFLPVISNVISFSTWLPSFSFFFPKIIFPLHTGNQTGIFITTYEERFPLTGGNR